jgi:integrase
MASSYIRKRNKKYSAILEVGRDAVTGKKIQKSLGSFNTKKEADIVLTAAMAKVNNGDYILPQKMKVKDFLNTWLETYAKNLSPTTYNGYKIIVNNHLNPAFGELEIQKLQPIHFQQYYNTKSETLKGKTLIQHHRVFRKALDYAWKNQLITKNQLTW